MDDEDLLRLVRSEKQRALGFELASELTAERTRGLNYIKGDVSEDVPTLKNRSSAVSSDVADAIRTLIPDLMEIFVGGDDVATFIPVGPEDEDQAQQETDYVANVVFQQNDGFETLYTMIDDALSVKTGVVQFWWEDYPDTLETLEGKSQEEAQAIQAMADQPGAAFKVDDVKAGEEPGTFDITISRAVPGRVCIKAVPPSDFAVASDTVSLREATYCAMRSRPRAQDLLAQGLDPEKVDQLAPYNTENETEELARDTVGEHTLLLHGDGGTADLRQVEVTTHFIKLYEDGRMVTWRVMTGNAEAVLLDKAKVDQIQFAAITPYPVSHRFYGQSVADLLIELQKINTVITRGYLDSLYFALNQRAEIAMNEANEFTLSDFLRNEPGMPVRSRTGQSVKPIVAGGAGFDGLAALEYFQTKAEQRTGIARHAQGLNPDTLHDTKGGVLALMAAAQRRTRLIARIFAETGIKDLFLGVHALLRKHSSQRQIVRLRGKWLPVDPSSWGERTDMNIEIGVGAGGKDQEIANLMTQQQAFEQIVTAQDGLNGPLFTWDNAYALMKRFLEKTGAKRPEAFITDPKGYQSPPPPDPNAHKQAEVQGQLQIQQAQAQSAMEVERFKAQTQTQIAQQKNIADAQLAQQKQAADAQLQREIAANELQQKAAIAQQELNMKQAIAERQFQLEQQAHAHRMSMAQAQSDAKIEAQVKVGGEPG